MKNSHLLLAGTFLAAMTSAAVAQDQAESPPPAQQQPDEPPSPPPQYEDDEAGDVIVTGARTGVIGNIPPENVLNTRDVLATGATDVTELLAAIAPQIGSARGRGGERPITLLNGQRVSGFRELRDIPSEAVARVEILPEEVALRYGYRADQKVVNIVLRPRFRSTVARIEGSAATAGGYGGGEADLTRLMIGKGSRTTLDLDLEANGRLTEDERLIQAESEAALDAQSARTLVGSRRKAGLTATHNRTIGAIAATGNLELEHVAGRSLIGLGETLARPLARDTASNSAHGGFVVNGSASGWRWSVTGNADLSSRVTRTDHDSADRDRSETTTASADVDTMASGSLFKLPAGDVGATVRAGASTLSHDSERIRGGDEHSASLGRSIAKASANLDLPVSRRASALDSLGNLGFNVNGEVERLSDFGTLTTVGAGANWSPVRRLDFIVSWTREEGAPTVQQLGDPLLETPGTRIFDFTTGETVRATALTGGNPGLGADRRNVWKVGGNWKPFAETDLTLRAEYVRSRLNGPISSFPGPTEALEAAFPERFVRDPDGRLVSVDLRPVNYESARRDTLRFGFDYSRPLKSAAPSQAAIAAFRARRQAAGGGSGPPGSESGPTGARPGGPGGGFGGFGGDRNRGRAQLSLTDTITFVDDVTIRDRLKLDYLGGDALSQSGGRPRHEVEGRAGYFNNGIGARVSANWRSGTRVRSATGDALRFSPLATVDLRLWADLGQQFDLVAKEPRLRGTSVRFEIRNLFDSKPRVRDSIGAIPFSYQADLLDPVGRTVSLSIRKLFLPPPGSFRRREAGSGGDD